MTEIKVGTRVEIKSQKTGNLLVGKITSIRKGIAKMTTDEGNYYVRAPVGQFILSTAPIKPSSLKKFEYTAWIHPKSGGDDYRIGGYTLAPTREEAAKTIEASLKRKSAVVDYQLI